MKFVVVLKAVEELTLQQMSINHRHRDTRTSAAGLLMLGRGLKARAIAAQLGVSGQSRLQLVARMARAGHMRLDGRT